MASEWVIDGETTLDNTLTSEFVYGGAWGFEQFYGFGFELSGDAAAALQQSLQPTFRPAEDGPGGRAGDYDAYEAEGPASGMSEEEAIDEASVASSDAEADGDEGGGRRRLLQQRRGTAERPGRDERQHDEFQQRQHRPQWRRTQARQPPPAGMRKPLSDKERRRMNLPKGAELIAQVRKPLPKEQTRAQVAEALKRRKERKRRRLLQEEGVEQGNVGNTEDGDIFNAEGEEGRDGEFTVTTLPGQVEDVTGADIGAITTNWFDSFPAALPTSIRDRLLAQLEEFVLDPQIAISLEIAIAFVGVVEPGVGIVSAEAADETTATYDLVFHGYDAAVDVAAEIERAQGVAGSASAGVAVSKGIINAAEVINAVTDIVDEVNSQVTDYLDQNEQLRLAEEEAAGEEETVDTEDVDSGAGIGSVATGVAGVGSSAGDGAINTAGTVTAQGGPSSSPKIKRPPRIVPGHNEAEPFRNLAGATRVTSKGKVPNREEATAPLRVTPQGARVRGMGTKKRVGNYTGAPGPEAAMGPAAGRGPYDSPYDPEVDYFGPTPDYDYEPFGAVSGTYAVAVSLIFLEQISLNGGSITII